MATKSNLFDLPSVLSIAKAGLGVAAQYSAYASEKYNTQLYNAAAQQKYWAEYADTTQRNYRDYEYQLESWYRASDYVEKRRIYESQLAEQQAVYKGQVGINATRNFEKQMADLEGRYYEEEAKDMIDLDNIRIKSIADGSKRVASGQAGRSVVNVTNQYNQQYLSNLSNREITRSFRIADKIRTAESLNVARENTVNQVQFYTPQPIADPVKPLAPLPIVSYAPTPAVGPSRLNLAVGIADVAADAYKTYKSMQPPAPTLKEYGYVPSAGVLGSNVGASSNYTTQQ
jgi:hypothetical protein